MSWAWVVGMTEIAFLIDLIGFVATFAFQKLENDQEMALILAKFLPRERKESKSRYRVSFELKTAQMSEI